MRFFKATDDIIVTKRKLPHWAQAETLCFITWRTCDSMPREVVDRWHHDREDWLRRHQVDPVAAEWRSRLEELPDEELEDFHERFTTQWHDELDKCHGACVLRRPELADLVRKSLLSFDGDRYDMHGFVIMPNHVHVLVAFPDEEAMLSQCKSWKRFTATRINDALGTSGRFWQPDAFDHLVRHEAQFTYLKRYLADNPVKAHLREGQYDLYLK